MRRARIKPIVNPFPTSHDTAEMLEEIMQANPYLNSSNPRLDGVGAIKKARAKRRW